MNYYFIILVIQFITLLGIIVYSNKINDNENKECNDILNQTFFKMRFSFWNFSHIVIFFMYCFILKPKTTFDHFKIFMIGVIWYLMQTIYHKDKKTKKKCDHSIAYENMLQPRLDDFIYNILGQLLYIVMTNGYCAC